MFKLLLIENDVKFVVKLQKIFPRDTEWVTSIKPETVRELLNQHHFDYIIARKKNEQTLENCLFGATNAQQNEELKLIKKIVLLPHFAWRRYLKKQMFK
jgi:hypothetical protein